MNLSSFTEVWAVDFEFTAPDGERPMPICMVAKELRSGHTVRLWQDELSLHTEPPFSMRAEALYVAYYASAEAQCHLALGWPQPTNVLDLFTEFRNHTNGLAVPLGHGLLGALAHFGLPAIAAAEKIEMRGLAMRGGPWTADEKAALTAYCESDVVALCALLPCMESVIDWPRAMLRGRYMLAAARIEHNGIPVDTDLLSRLRRHWEAIQSKLIAAVDSDYEVYQGGSFREVAFAHYLAARDIHWPQLASGRLDLTDETFKEMSQLHSELAPLRELRATLSQMRLSTLPVGQDGRNRTMLSAFRARTGRNQPSNSRFMFGPAKWLRSLIRPTEGYAIAYLDWSQQEFGIAAALSGDALMMEAYTSGDPYLAFAKQAGAVPHDGTKSSHRAERDQFKACVLAVQYGMGAESLAHRTGQPVARARQLLDLHRQTYDRFWQWSDAALDYAMLYSKLWTTFGWTTHVADNPNPRSLRNFPMQANGAEMLRLACIAATEAGIRVCAPVHDAILIEAPLDDIQAVVRQTQQLMEDASAIVLNGFRLRSDAKIVKYPERYVDEGGERMWRTVMDILTEIEEGADAA